ncbi:MAG TPA: hypothetical protein VHO71_04555 [Caproiciproducens sp.]|nr:hypothetical protein [Caproiciproducens sp.]
MMDNHELAVLLAQGAGNQDRSKTGQYYMLNINHPVIASLRRRFCQSREIPIHSVLSDEQRYEFELTLLAAGTRKVVEEFAMRPVNAEADGERKDEVEKG